MRDENHGLSLSVVKLKQFFLKHFSRLGVHRRKRLVHQKDLRIDRQCARQADALLHAAAKLVRIVIFETGESNESDIMLETLGKHAGRRAGNPESEADIAEYRFPGQQTEMLKDDGDALPRTVHHLSVDQNTPRTRRQ